VKNAIFAILFTLGSPAPNAPPVPTPILTSFSPVGVLAGEWQQDQVATPAHIASASGAGCAGMSRKWIRADGMELFFTWFSCGDEDIQSIARTHARTRVTQSREQSVRAVLPNRADVVTQIEDRLIVREWLQPGYVISLGAWPCAGRIDDCLDLTGQAATYIAAQLTDDPVIAAAPLPDMSTLFGAVLVYWVLFVGLPMLRNRIVRPSFDIGPNRPRVIGVDAAAQGLRWRSRGRRTGHVLIVIGVGALALVVVSGVLARQVYVAGIACAAFGLIIGVPLVRFCRHPQLTAAWLRYWPRLDRINPRRLAAALLTLLLAALAVAFPLAAVTFLVLMSLIDLGDGNESLIAGLSFAAAAVGYGIDHLARRLRARTAKELTVDRPERQLLYLRNFGDDELKVPSSPLSRQGLWQLLTAWANPIRQRRFEELLTRVLGRRGPVIGFNHPGLRLPTLGVAKQMAPNEHWQEQITQLAEDSYAIVVSATPTDLRPGLLWELDMLANTVSHGRIVLVLGPYESSDRVSERFGLFAQAVEKYATFEALTRGWVPPGALVLVHARSTGWHAWAAQQRTGWTYAAAIDAAFSFAETAWVQQEYAMNAEPVFTDTVIHALDYAAVQAGTARPIDTRLLLSALMLLDGPRAWSRIWLHGANEDAVASATDLIDARPQTWGYWRGQPFTISCEVAIAEAVRFAKRNNMRPVPIGLLAFYLVRDPTNSAAQALGSADHEQHRLLLTLIQQDLLGAPVITTTAAPAAAGLAPGIAPVAGAGVGSVVPAVAVALTPGAAVGVPASLPPVAGAMPKAVAFAVGLVAFCGCGSLRYAAEHDRSESIQMAALFFGLSLVAMWVMILAVRPPRFRWLIAGLGVAGVGALALTGVLTYHH